MHNEEVHIPVWVIRLIRFCCKEELHEEIEGNLMEYMNTVRGSTWGSWKFVWQLLTYLRPSTLKGISQNSKFYIMFNFNLIQTFRGLWKHRSTTFLNIGGYALGMLCVSQLYFYIKGEVSYDNFHTNGANIYRVIRISEMNGEKYNIGVTSGPFGPHLQMEFPSEIKSFVRVDRQEGLVEYQNKVFKENKILFADKNFFTFFSFPLLAGDPNTVLSQPNAIVMTRSAVKKYFGFEDPVGKLLTIDKNYQFMVTGVVDDLPAQSHLDFEFVGSLELFANTGSLDRWWNNGLSTYLEIDSPLLAESVQEKFVWFIDKYFGKDIAKSGKRVDIALEPFDDIYFHSDMRYDWVRHGSRQTVILLAVVALAILFIACFNYLNLSIALSFQRAREVGMRKILGGNRTRLVFQFLGESALIALLAIGVAIGLTELTLPAFNNLFDLEVETVWLDQNVVVFYGGLLVSTILLSGLYPSLLLSAFHPLSVLKGQTHIRRNNLWLRKGLVIVQFSISIFMIISTWMISAQLDFLNSKGLGFDREAIILVDLDNEEIRDRKQEFKEQLLQDPRVKSVTTMSGEPGGFHDATTLHFTGGLEPTRMRTAFVDLDYLTTFGIALEAGRNFDKSYRLNDAEASLVNKRAVDELGLNLEEIIGTKFRISMWDTLEHVIVGVTEDYHFTSLKDHIEPLVIVPGQYHRRAAIKVDPTRLYEGLRVIEDIYASLAPSYPVSYIFMDDELQRLYEDEQKQGRIFQAFSGVSVFLACLGIFGLVSFVVERRRKEFGIRKALGANVRTLLQIISREFVLMILVSSMVAIPLSWYAIDTWLVNFAYRIELMDFWGIFIAGSLVALALAILTIVVRAVRTAYANPTESLRYE